jgi:hypothetical protein
MPETRGRLFNRSISNLWNCTLERPYHLFRFFCLFNLPFACFFNFYFGKDIFAEKYVQVFRASLGEDTPVVYLESCYTQSRISAFVPYVGLDVKFVNCCQKWVVQASLESGRT